MGGRCGGLGVRFGVDVGWSGVRCVCCVCVRIRLSGRGAVVDKVGARAGGAQLERKLAGSILFPPELPGEGKMEM